MNKAQVSTGSNAISDEPSTARYKRKQDAIIAAATVILNRDGARGMTLSEVAGNVGLITTSLTYYFRKKEDLATACFLRTVERFDHILKDASRLTQPEDRVRRLIELYFGLIENIREGHEPPLATFSDVRALSEPHRSRVIEPYRGLFRKTRLLLQGQSTSWMSRNEATARTHLLLEQLHWTAFWLPCFETEDFLRLINRMSACLFQGLAPTEWTLNAIRQKTTYPEFLARLDPRSDVTQDQLRENFLISATRLVNQRGYRGASVEQISRQLNVTKGSFYHHNDAKDDLVASCFERYFNIVRRAQAGAALSSGAAGERLKLALIGLADYQLSKQGPLLRVSALGALPENLRLNMLERSNQMTTRYAALIADGIADGSIHPVDPFIASHMISAGMNATASAGDVLNGLNPEDVGDLYLPPMLNGLFTRPVKN